ncbi:uncharacterized protein LOC116620008 isoform X2 [Nematostella vectensis]|uniref:uncharacterized protein LOC116620008 isoform X2 n=1 Tax=Nematostella vectensis TaxID=45351 RepID=UPI0020771AB6|nr:uncharacterized protein LOC116620008 isoform X2 [Nematostella vectensis]
MKAKRKTPSCGGERKKRKSEIKREYLHECSNKENVPPDDKGEPEKKRRPRKREGKGLSLDSGRAAILANNRELAVALEEAQIKINKLNLTNVEIKKQLQGERQMYIDKLQREVDKQLKEKFDKINQVLQEVISKFLECSTLMQTINSLVAFPTAPTTTPLTYSLHALSFNTTPPPDEPVGWDPMEVGPTISTPGPDDFVIQENNDFTTAFVEPMQMDELSFMGGETDLLHNRKPGKDTNRITQSPRERMSPTAYRMTRTPKQARSSVNLNSQTTPLIPATERALRRTPSVTYTMPSLRSKLRRGDPFTDSSLYNAFPEKRKCPRVSTGCLKKRPRSVLSNISNTISEET